MQRATGCAARRLTWNVHDDAAGLGEHGGAPGHVPAVDAQVVVSVGRAAGHQTHVDGGAARWADAEGANGTHSNHQVWNATLQISAKDKQRI